MNCQKCKIEIEDRDARRDYLSNAAEAHMAACASCRVFGEERLALRRLVGGLERVSAPADFEFRMRARMAAGRGASRAAWFNFSPAALSWPLAGCLALVVSASLYFQARRPETPAALPAEHARTRAETPASRISVAEAARQSVQEMSSEVNSEVKSEPRTGASAGSLKTSAAKRPRAVPVRLALSAGAGRGLAQVEESVSTGLIGSMPRFAAGAATRGESMLIPVQLDAPEGQLKVLLRDTSGGARTISVDSVSFGSRDVMGRPAATNAGTPLSSNEGVW